MSRTEDLSSTTIREREICQKVKDAQRSRGTEAIGSECKL